MILVARRSNKQIRAVKFLITSLFFIIINGALFAETEAELSPQQSQQQIAVWLEVETTIADERKEYRARLETLEKLLDIYQLELDMLKEGIAAAGGALSDSDSKLEIIKESTRQHRQVRERLEVKVAEQSKRLRAIMNRFPRPLSDELAAERLTLSDPATKLRSKVLAMVAVVKATVKFNQVVTYSEEVQVVDGVERQVQVLYLGLGRGYYVSGETAGIVDVGASGWVWSRKDKYLKAISRAIAVYQKTARPELVKLPIQLSK